MPSLFHRAAALTCTAGLALTCAVLTASPSGAATTKPILGPDVSSYQHPGGAAISWTKVHKAGASFAIVKATEGTSYVNPYFAKDYAAAGAAGLVRGSYHFARPATPVASSAWQQAKSYVDTIGNTKTAATLPPALDLEVTGGLGQSQLIRWAQDWLVDVRKLSGRTPLLYTYPSFWSDTMADAVAFARYPIWMASYSSTTPSGATLWQFTSSASLNGIRGGVDESRYVGNRTWPWATISDGTVATAWKAAAPGAPQGVWASLATGTSSGGTAVVHFLPGDAGTRPISGFTVTANPGGKHVSVGASATSATVTGLKYGRTYTFTVQAANQVGDSVASAPTNAVTPLLPTALAVPAPAKIKAGDHVTLTGTLTRTDTGEPLAGQTVELLRKRAGQTAWHKAAVASTSESGTVSFTRGPTVDTAWEMAYAGGSGRQPAAAVVTTRVAPVVTLTSDATAVAVGQWIHLTGTVTPVTKDITIVRQVRGSDGWIDTKQQRTLDAGDFAFAFRLHAAGTVVIRVRVTAAGGREPAVSRKLTITAS